MKKKNINIIPLLTLVVTLFMVIVATFSWYVVNNNADAQGSSATIKSKQNVYVSTTYDGSDDYIPVTDIYTDGGFAKVVSLGFQNSMLMPASTFNANDFYYALSADEDGHAKATSPTGPYFASVPDSLKNFYYLEKDIYLCTTETTDVSAYIRSLQITSGSTGGNVYKAVRVSVKYGNYLRIFRSTATQALQPGYYPVTTGPAVGPSDPSIVSGSLANTVYPITIPKAVDVVPDGETDAVLSAEPVKLTIKIWIEGQDSNAITANAGTAFRLKFLFDTID